MCTGSKTLKQLQSILLSSVLDLHKDHLWSSDFSVQMHVCVVFECSVYP
jgi:hypothetical protein